MNPAERYVRGLEGLGIWSPQQATPFDPEVLGFELGANVQTPLDTYMKQAFVSVWKVLPTHEIDDLVARVISKAAELGSRVSDLLQFAAEILSGVASAASLVLPVVEAIFSAPSWVSTMVIKQQAENDQRRRDARLAAAQLFEDLHPRYWVTPGNMAYGYNRKRKYDTTVVGAMIYPPAASIPFGTTPAQGRSGNDCEDARVSSADWCGMDDCQWGWGYFPMFFPYFHPDVFGRVWAPGEGHGAPVYLRGMQGSNDGGGAVLATLMGYQTALLTNPLLNLHADGSQVQAIWDFFYRFFWTSYWEWSPKFPETAGLPKGELGVFNEKRKEWTRIDKSFNEQNGGPDFGDHLYLAPNGMIGAYTPALDGSIEDPVLNDWKVSMFDPTVGSYSSTGGNEITCRDYNTVLAIVQSFFATRRATLRDEGFCRRMVEEAPELFEKRAYPDPYALDENGILPEYHIVEEPVREAIRARAAGNSVGAEEVILKLPAPRRKALASLTEAGESVMAAAVSALRTPTPKRARLVSTKPGRQALGDR